MSSTEAAGMLRSYVRLLERRRVAMLVAFVWLIIFGAGIAAATRVFANLKLRVRCSVACFLCFRAHFRRAGCPLSSMHAD